jgi:hypothetical protein
MHTDTHLKLKISNAAVFAVDPFTILHLKVASSFYVAYWYLQYFMKENRLMVYHVCVSVTPNYSSVS